MTLTLMDLSVIFVIGLWVILWLKPPQIHFTVNASQLIPSDLHFSFSYPKLKNAQGEDVDESLPVDILEYCEQESDEWARESRKLRARRLKLELGSWDLAFKQLQKEDAGFNE